MTWIGQEGAFWGDGSILHLDRVGVNDNGAADAHGLAFAAERHFEGIDDGGLEGDAVLRAESIWVKESWKTHGEEIGRASCRERVSSPV